ncbi:MAG: hypothetical protein JNK11_08305 [Alphaproteobacteria bacterium]|nr:hypothetical protein [Alphaproteobacteria bacterium]
MSAGPLAGRAVRADAAAAARPLALPAAYALIAAAACVAALAMGPGGPILTPDSSSYMTAQPIRPIGYPAFLHAVIALFGSIAAVPALQVVAYGTAAAALATACARLVRSAAVGLTLLLLLVGNAAVLRHGFMVMAEAPHLVALLGMLAAAATHLRTGSRSALATASACVGAGILIRPVDMALVAGLVALAWPALRRASGMIVPGRAAFLGTSILALCLPAAGLWAAGTVIQQARHGSSVTGSFFGFSLLGKVAPLLVTGAPSEHPAIRGAIVPLAAPYRAAMQTGAGWLADQIIDIAAYNPLLYRYAWDAAVEAARAQRCGAAAAAACAVGSIDRAAVTAFGLDFVTRRPAAYAEAVAQSYLGLWVPPPFVTQAEADLIRSSFARAAASVPLDPVTLHIYPLPMVILVRCGLALAFLSSWLALAAWLAFPRSCDPIGRMLMLGAVAAAATHAVFLATAGLQPALPRYAIGMWPTVAILAVLPFAICYLKLRTRWLAD